MPKISNPTFLKWAGGKTQMLEQYKLLFPAKFNNYHEPFLGSGAVFFYIRQAKHPKKSFISDVNKDLINTFVMVRDRTNDLIELLAEHKRKNHSREYFNQQRKLFNSEDNPLEKAARFIYLNKTCFNGLYRVNSKGEFNVPFGRYENPAILQEDKLREAGKLLKGEEIFKASFASVLNTAEESDFVYFDPPYFPLSATANFTGYQKASFLHNEQRKLAEVAKKLDRKGCFVMVSNSDTPFIHKVYSDFLVTPVSARRAINCVGTKRGSISELVIRNFH